VPSFQTLSLGDATSVGAAKGNPYSSYVNPYSGYSQQYGLSDPGTYQPGVSPSLSADDFPPIRVGQVSGAPKKGAVPMGGYAPDGNKYYNPQTSPQKSYPQSMGQTMKMPPGNPRLGGNGYYVPDNSAAIPEMYYYPSGSGMQQPPQQRAPSFNPMSQLYSAGAPGPMQPQAGPPQPTTPSQLPSQQPQQAPGRRPIHSFFMSDTLRSDMQKKTLLLLRGSNPDGTCASRSRFWSDSGHSQSPFYCQIR
jgi:hypothetical protein